MKTNIMNEIMNGKTVKNKSNDKFLLDMMGSPKKSKTKVMDLFGKSKQPNLDLFTIKKQKSNLNGLMVSPMPTTMLFSSPKKTKQKKSSMSINHILGNKIKSKPTPKLMRYSEPDVNNLKNLFIGQGHPNPLDRKTKSQKRFLNKTKLGSGKSHMRFWDTDGDGVINGLDCYYKDPKRHGFFSKAKNWMKGEGYKETEEIRAEKDTQRLEREIPDVELKRLEEQEYKDEKERLEQEKQDILERKQQQMEELAEEKKRIEEEKLFANKEKQQVKIDIQNQMGKEEQYISERMKEIDEIKYLGDDDKKRLREKLRDKLSESNLNKLKEKDPRLHEIRKTLQEKEAEFKELENLRKSKLGEYYDLKNKTEQQKEATEKIKKNYNENIMDSKQKYVRAKSEADYYYSKKDRIDADKYIGRMKRIEKEQKPKQLVNRVGGWLGEKLIDSGNYRLEKSGKETERWVKGKYPTTDAQGNKILEEWEGKMTDKKPKGFIKHQELDKATGKPTYKKVADLSRGLSRTFGYAFEDKKERSRLKQDDYKRAVEQAKLSLPLEQITKIKKSVALTDDERNRLYLREAQEREDLKIRQLKKEQAQQQLLYAQLQQEQSKTNIGNLRSARGGSSLRGMFDSQPLVGRKPMSDMMFRKPIESYGGRTFDQSQSPNINPYLIKQDTRYYDPESPKFVYRRNVDGFTRKTNRVVADDELELNKPSMPSTETKEGSLYPWTKPMKGWERVYVGKGRWIGKGRSKRGKSHKQYSTYGKISKPKKGKFVKFAKTYYDKS